MRHVKKNADALGLFSVDRRDHSRKTKLPHVVLVLNEEQLAALAK